MGSKQIARVALALFFAGAAPAARALPQAHVRVRAPQATPRVRSSGSIAVYVRDAFGFPLARQPSLSLSSFPHGRRIPILPSRVDGAWLFAPLRPGEKVFVRVAAAGFRAARKPVVVPRRRGATAYALFFLQPSGERIFLHPPQLSFALPPLAQKQVQPAMLDLARRKTKPAWKHLRNALRFAPENPLVNALAGLCLLRANRPRRAEAYLNKAVSADPRDLSALLGLGVARYSRGDFAGAIRILRQARRLDPSSWRVPWMLAACYLRRREFLEARQSAEQARTLAAKAGRKAPGADLLLAMALDGLGQHEQASSAFGVFQRSNPRSPLIEPFRRDAKSSRGADAEKDAVVVPSGPISPPPSVLLVPKLRRDFWVPPEVDAERPFLISSAGCPLPEILKGAAARAVQYVKDIQEFTAVEDYQSLEIKRNGKLGDPFDSKFSYLVFLEQNRPDLIQSTVMRDRSFALTSAEIGSPVMDTGSPVMALVFHPVFAGDFAWKCEGLGEWRGRPAWVIHFRQRSDRPLSRLHGFDTPTAEYLEALKGLAWVTTDDDRVVRLETDMAKPLSAVHLDREHFVIEYREVAFRSHPVRLWLPEMVDAFLVYRGKSYHHYHRFSHFELFWAGPRASGKKTGGKNLHP